MGIMLSPEIWTAKSAAAGTNSSTSISSCPSLSKKLPVKDLDLAIIVEDSGRSALKNKLDFVDGDYIDGLAKVSRIRDMLEDGKYVAKSDLEVLVDALITDKVTKVEAFNKVSTIQRDVLSPKDKILFDYAKRYIENDS